MRRTALIAAAIGGLFASSSFGAFIFTVTATDLSGPLQQVDVFARNDGTGGTGTKLAAVSFRYQGSSTVFNYGDLDGDPDTANEVDVPNSGNALNVAFVRIGTASNTFIVGGATKINGVNVAPTDSRFGSGVTDFEIAAAFSGAAPTANTGNGPRLGRFIIADGGAFTLSSVLSGVANLGGIGGDTGPAIPFLVAYPVNAPEPTTLATIGLAGLGLIRRRK